MQTERVTFLTSRGQKAALDAFAASNGRSVGHVLREASTSYIAQPSGGQKASDEEAALEALTIELEGAIPQMRADIDAMRRDLSAANAAVEDYFREKAERDMARAAA